jgi:hypothetical protein
VQRINQIDNVPRASGPTPTRLETNDEFVALMDAMAPLIRTGKLRFELEDIAVGESPAARRVVLRVLAAEDDAVRGVVRMLELASDRDHYPLATGAAHAASGPPWDSICVQTRSLLGVLFFIANGVEVPAAHARAGVVTTTVGNSGADFDWAAITDDVLHIRTSHAKPDRARMLVRHRKQWFYIDDTDVKSKSTFLLLSLLYALQAAPPSGGGPTLTLPVGGR